MSTTTICPECHCNCSHCNRSSISLSFEPIDNTLNTLGYIPIVSNFSGGLRVFLGTIQAVAALAALMFGLATNQFNMNGKTLAHMTLTIVSGIANMVRGTIEQLPLAGNLACYGYDFLKSKIIS
jgi:hypothetical protein